MKMSQHLDELGRLQCHVGVLALVFGLADPVFFGVALACFLAAFYTCWRMTP